MCGAISLNVCVVQYICVCVVWYFCMCGAMFLCVWCNILVCVVRGTEPTLKHLKINLHYGQDDKIKNLPDLNTDIKQALIWADIRYMRQLTRYASAIEVIDEIHMGGPAGDIDSDGKDRNENWGRTTLSAVQRFVHNRIVNEVPDSSLEGNIDVFTDRSVVNDRATAGIYIQNKNEIMYGKSVITTQ